MTIEPGTPRTGAAVGATGRDGRTIVLSGEQLVTGTEWVESGQVRLRRRIVSETRTVEVTVRREELVIDTADVVAGTVGESFRGAALDGPAVSGPPERPATPLIVLLREEIPVVVLHVQAYERVTAELVTSDEVAVWHDSVRHEQAAFDVPTDD